MFLNGCMTVYMYFITGIRKAVDAVAPSRPQRPRARDHSFLLPKGFEKLRRRNRKLNDVSERLALLMTHEIL